MSKAFNQDFVDNKLKQDSCMAESSSPPQSSLQLSAMCSEENRYRTFEFWSVPFINKRKLAQFGFYYIGPNDLVKCYFCKVEIGCWEQGDNVLSEHMRWSPHCPLLVRCRETDNVPIDSNFANLLPQQSYDTCGLRISPTSEPEESIGRPAYNSQSSKSSMSSSLSSSPMSTGILTSDDDMIFEAIKNGARGYLLKDEKTSTIIEQIQQLLEIGGAPMSPLIARKALALLSRSSLMGNETQNEEVSNKLSERECDVLKLLVEGRDAKAIAEKLFLSTHTIRKHIANIYTKLHVSSKAQVINLALQNKWFKS